jgi:hypothetical protein
MARRRHRFAVLLLAAGLLLAPRPAAGQDADRDVIGVVEKLFDAMRAADTVAIRAVFAPDARLVRLSRASQVQITTVDQFIRSIASSQSPLNERIYKPEVRIDGNLATVWTFYTLHVGDRLSHCGYDAFQLLRLPQGWKIVNIADTYRMENCSPPGG